MDIKKFNMLSRHVQIVFNGKAFKPEVYEIILKIEPYLRVGL